MGRTPEGKVEDYLIDQCRQNAFTCWKFVSPGRRGVPDRVVVTPAGTLFVETKRPRGGVLSKSQIAMHAKIRRSGGEVHVAATRMQVNQLVRMLVSRVGQMSAQPSETEI